MKSISKILSAYALLVAVATCHGAEQKGQKVNFYITNNLPTSASVYGNVYETSVTGKVTDKSKLYYKIDHQTCLEVSKNKSAKIKDRLTKYHRLIFATTESALKDKVINNKDSADVDSIAINQALKQDDKISSECYSIGSTGNSKNINIISDTCTSCSGSLANKRTYKISGIKAPKSGGSLLDEYASGIAATTKQ